GTVAGLGADVRGWALGERAGVPWLGWTCGECRYCRTGRENLCQRARFTGYHLDGGYTEYTVADARYVFRIPADYQDLEAAPLLWGERVVRSIANLTRRDGEEFLALAPRVPVHTQIESFPLDQANEALNRLRAGAVRGAAVLAVNSPAE